MSERVGGDPVRFFKDLYAVVVGVALTLAVEQLVDLHREGVPIRWEHVPLFISWVSVAFPFAHIFVRYLDVLYGKRIEGGAGRGLAMGNIFVGATHYLWIIALALFFTRPLVYGYALVLFIAGALVRDLFLRRHPRAWHSDLERRVAPVFVVTTLGWLAVMVFSQLALDGSTRDWTIRGGVLALSLVFAFGIYLRAYDYFFVPTPEGPTDDPG
jgi:hypothetical protein